MNMNPIQTVSSRLLWAASQAPIEGVTFLDRKENETVYTWPEVVKRARRAAGALAAQGVKPGQHVAIVLPTGPEFLDAFFGCQLLGAVPVPLYPPVRLGRMTHYIERTAVMMESVDVVLLVTDARIRRVMGQVVARYRPPLGLILAKHLQAGTPGTVHLVQPDELALIQFSSGTTVRPKPVGLTHRQILANIQALTEFIPGSQTRREVGVCWLPLYHDMGLIGCLLTAALRPGALVLIPPEVFLIQPAIWLRAISKYGGTISPAPNFAYALCTERVKAEDLADCDLSSWRLALNGAEPISADCLRAFQAKFSPWGLSSTALTPVYGLAESALAVTFSRPEDAFVTQTFDPEALCHKRAEPMPDGVELVSVGQPVLGCEVEIRGDDAQALPPAHVGEIWTRGPSVMRGYVDRDEQPFREGWLATGDLGVLVDGHLYVTGRKKDVIIIRGQNHAPHDIERAVDSVDGVRTGCAAAFGAADAEGERLIVLVEAREMRPDMVEECHSAILQTTNLRPDVVELLAPGTLPRTSSGKIRRGEARKLWQAGHLTRPKSVNPLHLAGVMARSALGYLRAQSDSGLEDTRD